MCFPAEWQWKSLPTLHDPMDYRIDGILQARILEWVAFPFSRGSSQPRDQTQGSNPGIKPRSPALQVDSLPTELPGDYKEPGSNFQPEEQTAKKLAHCFRARLKNGCCVQIILSSYGLFKKWKIESCFDRTTSANQSWKWTGEILVAAETGSNQLEQRNLHPDWGNSRWQTPG